MPAALAARLVASVCPDLSESQAAQVALACRCLPLGLRLVSGLMADGRLTLKASSERLVATALADWGGGGGLGWR